MLNENVILIPNKPKHIDRKKSQALPLSTIFMGSKKSYLLERMPMWGEKVSPDQINFSWPSLDLLNNLPANTKLQKMTMKSVLNAISSVQCLLSDGTESPIFEKAEARHEI